jgi:hypothetical protein
MIPQFSEANAGSQRFAAFRYQLPPILSHAPLSGIRPPPSRRKIARSPMARLLAATKTTLSVSSVPLKL